MAQLFDVVVDAGNEAEKPVCLGGRYELAPNALKEGIAELLLGVRQHLADRRLRDIQQPRRIGHRAARVNGMKHLDLAQSHPVLP